MPEARTAPYGSWGSPVSSGLIVRGVISLGGIKLDGQDVYWIEGRPGEGGRNVVVRRAPDGGTEDVTPQPFNARTRVHEYGGGDFVAHDGALFFSNFDDQRLYSVPSGGEPRPLTRGSGKRYADMTVDGGRNRILAVREDHSGGHPRAGREPVNELIDVSLDDGVERVLASGADFYSSPRLSPDGRRLAWLAWDHPNMPWDGTELWVGELGEDGLPESSERVAGGPEESVFQPEWSPDGTLYFVSDRTGWWNLYRLGEGPRGEEAGPLREMEAEFGLPQWRFGMSTYAFVSPTRIVCAYVERGSFRLGRLDVGTGELEGIETPYSTISSVTAGTGAEGDGFVVFRGGSPTEPSSVVRLDLATGEHEVLGRSSDLEIDAGYVSVPEPVEFPTEGGKTAHAFFYPPENRDYSALEGELPPLLVMGHGGPTSMATTTLDLEVQYWTSRGIAGLDVNYGGSTV